MWWTRNNATFCHIALVSQKYHESKMHLKLGIIALSCFYQVLVSAREKEWYKGICLFVFLLFETGSHFIALDGLVLTWYAVWPWICNPPTSILAEAGEYRHKPPHPLEEIFHHNPAARNPFCVLRPFMHLNVSTKLYPVFAVEMWLFVNRSFQVLKLKKLRVS